MREQVRFVVLCDREPSVFFQVDRKTDYALFFRLCDKEVPYGWPTGYFDGL